MVWAFDNDILLFDTKNILTLIGISSRSCETLIVCVVWI